ncbi:MAG: M48 family metalloprotease [Deltaproteobacteria bacterium]|nr:M48 family metalloprotease [Deltaproteobacteria bacterium]
MNYKKTATIALTLITIFTMVFYAEKPSYASFTLADENKLGKEFYDKLKGKGVLLDDRKITDYVNKIGQDLVDHSTTSLFAFTFSVIKSSGINAFATPGGYIYIYEGLIKLAEDESQLAGVLAHEIAHVQSRHIAESIEKSQKLSLATLVGILAGVFLGGGGEGSAAIATMTMATATSLNLKYTRENEEEADRKGMRYMTKTGYDGQGMLDFLKIMRRYEYFSDSIPSYFLTHPGTNDRIRYLDGLLHAVYTKRGAKSIMGGLNRIKTILVLREKDLNSSLKYFQNALQENPHDVDFLYGLAVIQSKMGKVQESQNNFSRALQRSPHDEDILRDVGISYYKMGNAKDAIKYLRQAYLINNKNVDTILYLGRSYEAVKDYSSTLDLYKKFQKDNPDDVPIYYNLAMTYGKIGDPGESHYNFGIYFKKRNKLRSALFHFKAARSYFPAETERGKAIQKEINSLNN